AVCVARAWVACGARSGSPLFRSGVAPRQCSATAAPLGPAGARFDLRTTAATEVSRVGLVFLIDRPGYRLATDRKVLKRNEAAVIEEITQAYVRAQDEINTALANVDSACTKATDDAYRKGLVKAEREATQ